MMGMAWAASVRPIEVTLNGDYIGLYYLAETNRIDPNRVDIYEQPEKNEEESTIDGGWLVEVDNYYEEESIVIQENSRWSMRITYHSPDLLSPKQKRWLTSAFTEVNAAIYAEDKEASVWEEMVDVEAMARYFIVQEVLDNPDGFHGSFYLHKDLGEDTRWVAGPLWDLSCSMRDKTDYTFRMKTSYGFTPHWIGELIKDEDFCQAVCRQWGEFYPSKVDAWMEYIDRHLVCDEAYRVNNERWPSVNYAPLADKVRDLKASLMKNLAWFDAHLPGNPSGGIGGPTMPQRYVVYNLQGMKVGDAATYSDAVQGLSRGIYILLTVVRSWWNKRLFPDREICPSGLLYSRGGAWRMSGSASTYSCPCWIRRG